MSSPELTPEDIKAIDDVFEESEDPKTKEAIKYMAGEDTPLDEEIKASPSETNQPQFEKAEIVIGPDENILNITDEQKEEFFKMLELAKERGDQDEVKRYRETITLIDSKQEEVLKELTYKALAQKDKESAKILARRGYDISSIEGMNEKSRTLMGIDQAFEKMRLAKIERLKKNYD